MGYTFKLSGQLALPRCPHCGVHSPLLSGQMIKPTQRYDGSQSRVWGAYECATCAGWVIAWAKTQEGQVEDVFPTVRVVSDDIPVQARNFLTQALESLNAPSGAIMLAGSAVDAMLKAKGYTSGSLYSSIEDAAAKHLITREMSLWAHEIRLEANDERHADLGSDPPDLAEAARSVDFALALGEFLFVLPARVTRGIAASASPSASVSPSSSASSST